jgi:hypothetical protein
MRAALHCTGAACGYQARNVPIRTFLEHDHSFGPEDIAGLSAAFEAALSKLGLVDRTDLGGRGDGRSVSALASRPTIGSIVKPCASRIAIGAAVMAGGEQFDASTNRRGRRATYPAVCGKRATLPGNVDRAIRKPQCGRNRTNGWNVKWPSIRAWGQYHSRRYWIDGRRIRAAPKAPQRKRPCRSRALSVDPSCSFVRCDQPSYAAGFSAVVPAHAGRLLERRDQVASMLARAIASTTSVSLLQRHEPTPR